MKKPFLDSVGVEPLPGGELYEWYFPALAVIEDCVWMDADIFGYFPEREETVH